MIPIKTESEIQSMREAGGVASLVLRQVAARVEAGIRHPGSGPVRRRAYPGVGS